MSDPGGDRGSGESGVPVESEGGERRGVLLVLAAAALFSTGGAALKSPGLPNWQVAGMRPGIAAIAMLALVPAARRGWSGRTLLVGAAYAATLLLFAFSTRTTTAANAIFLQSTAPLWVLALSPWLLRERLRPADLAFMGILAAGLALVFMGRSDPTATAQNPQLGDALGAASGLTWALAVIGLRWLARGDGTGSAAAASTVAGNLLCFLVCLPFAWPLQPGTFRDWAVLTGLGVFQVALAYHCLALGVRRVPAFEASLLLLLEPVLNPVWTWIVHGETPAPMSLAGGAVILAATAVYTFVAARR